MLTTDQQAFLDWIELARTDYLREQAKNAIASGRRNESLLLSLIRKNTTNAACLFRGMRVLPDDPLLTASVGSAFEMLPSSFSRTIEVGATYANISWDKLMGWENPAAVPILLVLKNQWEEIHFGKIRALEVAAYLNTLGRHDYGQMQEVITAGEFRVLAAEPFRNNGRTLVVRQLAIY
jgi:hypothetical protein